MSFNLAPNKLPELSPAAAGLLVLLISGRLTLSNISPLALTLSNTYGKLHGLLRPLCASCAQLKTEARSSMHKISASAAHALSAKTYNRLSQVACCVMHALLMKEMHDVESSRKFCNRLYLIPQLYCCPWLGL